VLWAFICEDGLDRVRVTPPNLLLSNPPNHTEEKTKLALMMRFARSPSSDKSTRDQEIPL
jgi:hypothetical protein